MTYTNLDLGTVSWGVIDDEIKPCEDIAECQMCDLYNNWGADYWVAYDCGKARKMWLEQHQGKEIDTVNDTTDDNETYRLTPKGILHGIFMDLEIQVSDAIFEIIWELFETRMIKMGYVQSHSDCTKGETND